MAYQPFLASVPFNGSENVIDTEMSTRYRDLLRQHLLGQLPPQFKLAEALRRRSLANDLWPSDILDLHFQALDQVREDTLLSSEDPVRESFPLLLDLLAFFSIAHREKGDERAAEFARVERYVRSLDDREREIDRLRKELTQRNKELTTLREIGEHLMAVHSLEELLPPIARAAAELIDCECAVVYVWNAERGCLLPAAFHGLPEAQLADVSFRPNEGVTGKALVTRQVVCVENALEHPDTVKHLIRRFSARNIAAVPMLVEDGAVGVLCVLNRRDGAFQQNDLRLFRMLANQAAIAIRSAQLLSAASWGRQMAEEASRVKSEFLANISHELRTPLTPILAGGAMLRDKVDRLRPEMVREIGQVIADSAARMVQMVSDILDISAVESRAMGLDLREVSLNGLVEDVTRQFEEELKSKSHELQVTLGELPAAYMDPVRIKQVLHNLVDNAIKYTPQGGNIFIRTLYDDTDETVQCEVCDTGIGIRPEQKGIIFDRFRQGDGSTTRLFGGTGLGLNLVQSLVAMHGGRVSVYSAGEGKGACFAFSIPVHGAVSDAAIPFAGMAAPGDPLVDARILIVEKKPEDRRACSLIFEGVQCFFASDGRDAVDLARNLLPDIILMDLELPVLDGGQALSLLRQDLLTADIPVIAVTSLSSATERERLGHIGFAETVVKPFAPAELRRTVRAVLRAHRNNAGQAESGANEGT